MNAVVLGMVKQSIDQERARLNHLLKEISKLESQVEQQLARDTSPEVSYLRHQLQMLRKRSLDLRKVVDSGDDFVRGMAEFGAGHDL